MIKITVHAQIDRVKAAEAVEFFVNCTDAQYAGWWPGEHIAFHTLKRTPEVIGNIVFFDEWVGGKRLKFQSRVTQYDAQGLVEYQMMKWGVRLPAWVCMEFRQQGDHVAVGHTLKIGFNGCWSILDCMIRPFVLKKFASELDRHAQEEFKRLSYIINNK